MCVISGPYQNQPITTISTSNCCSLTKKLGEEVTMVEVFSPVCLLREITNQNMRDKVHCIIVQVGTEKQRNFNLKKAKIKRCVICKIID